MIHIVPEGMISTMTTSSFHHEVNYLPALSSLERTRQFTARYFQPKNGLLINGPIGAFSISTVISKVIHQRPLWDKTTAVEQVTASDFFLLSFPVPY